MPSRVPPTAGEGFLCILAGPVGKVHEILGKSPDHVRTGDGRNKNKGMIRLVPLQKVRGKWDWNKIIGTPSAESLVWSIEVLSHDFRCECNRGGLGH